jgi:flagellar protein FliS
MSSFQEGYSQYKELDLASQTASASAHQLVLILYGGLMDELVRARGHIEHRRFERKVQSINKCIDILNALTSALDFEVGGEVVFNLASLYDYCVYRLYEASAAMSVQDVNDVMHILNNLRQGWEGLAQKLE